MKSCFSKRSIQSFLTLAIIFNYTYLKPTDLQAEEDTIRQNATVNIECSSKRFCLQRIYKAGQYNLLNKVIIVDKKGNILKEYPVNKVKGALKKKVLYFVNQQT